MISDPYMIEAAREGFEGLPNRRLFSSATWMAHQVGAELATRKMRAPTRCSMSRGFNVNVQTMSGAKFVVNFGDSLSDLAFKPKA